VYVKTPRGQNDRPGRVFIKKNPYGVVGALELKTNPRIDLFIERRVANHVRVAFNDNGNNNRIEQYITEIE